MKTPPQTFRSFWHGSPLGPYQLLCLRSFVDYGHQVEIFTYDEDRNIPDWVVHRDAREILPTNHVLHYQSGYGKGSPALHSDLFRYKLLERLGDWWIDLDVVALRPDMPQEDFFFAMGPPGTALFSGVLRAPSGHPLLCAAVSRSLALLRPDITWGDIGPRFFTALVDEYKLTTHIRPAQVAYPVPEPALQSLFDPTRCDEVLKKCADSWFLHLWNETSRTSGLPRYLAPPLGSFMDWLFCQHDFGFKFQERMRYSDVERWISNRNERQRLELLCTALQTRCREQQSKLEAVELIRPDR